MNPPRSPPPPKIPPDERGLMSPALRTRKNLNDD